MSQAKYPIRPARCAECGRPIIDGKGWFCSYGCDEAELQRRFERSKALFIARGGNDGNSSADA